MSNQTVTTLAIALTATAVAVGAGYYYYSRCHREATAAPVLNIYVNNDELSKELCAYVVHAAKEAISKRNVFYLAVAGGSLLDHLKTLELYKNEVDFSKIVLIFVNHKCVEPTEIDATYTKCKVKFADAVGITQIVKPFATSISGSDGGAEAAFYAKAMREAGIPHRGELPLIDLVLLGLGVDGHVGSCRPNSLAAMETQLSVTSSAKEGEPSSITLTIEAMNSAKKVGIVVSSGSKAKKKAVKRAMLRPAEEPRGTFPAQLLKSPLFFLDADAASDLD